VDLTYEFRLWQYHDYAISRLCNKRVRCIGSSSCRIIKERNRTSTLSVTIISKTRISLFPNHRWRHCNALSTEYCLKSKLEKGWTWKTQETGWQMHLQNAPPSPYRRGRNHNHGRLCSIPHGLGDRRQIRRLRFIIV